MICRVTRAASSHSRIRVLRSGSLYALRATHGQPSMRCISASLPASNRSFSTTPADKTPPADKDDKIEQATTLEPTEEKTQEVPMDTMSSVKALCIGTFAGAAGSWVGMGGGFVMIPLMLAFLKMSPHQAHGTSLAAVASTGTCGALSYYTHGAVDLEAAMWIAGAGVVAAPAGAKVAQKLSAKLLKKYFGYFLLLVAPLVPLKAYLVEQAAELAEENKGQENTENQEMFQSFQLACVGTGVGFTAGLFGVGGGTISVPAIALVTSLNHYSALGTSLAAMVMPSLAGLAQHVKMGNVMSPRITAPLILGSAVGSYMGAQVAVDIPENLLRGGFSVLLFGLGIKSVTSA